SQCDAVEWLSSLADGSADLVVTDPPYESLEKHRAVGTTTRLKHSKASSNDWFTVFPNARFEELLRQVYRVLKRDRHFYTSQATPPLAIPPGSSITCSRWLSPGGTCSSTRSLSSRRVRSRVQR